MFKRPYLCETEFRMGTCCLVGGPHAGIRGMHDHQYGIIYPTDGMLSKCRKLGADTAENG